LPNPVSDKKSDTFCLMVPTSPSPTFKLEPTVSATLAAALDNCPTAAARILDTPIHYLVDKIKYIVYNRV